MNSSSVLMELSDHHAKSAEFMPDVFLCHVLDNLPIILSGAIHLVYGDDVKKEIITTQAVKSLEPLQIKRHQNHYGFKTCPVWLLNKMPLLPPIGLDSEIVKWASKSRARAMHLFVMAWALDKERQLRFDTTTSAAYNTINMWQMQKTFLNFPDTRPGTPLEQPFLIPMKYRVDIPQHWALYEKYKQYLKMLEKDCTISLKWTKRDKPAFMSHAV